MKKQEYYPVDIEILPNCFMLCGEDMNTGKKFSFVLWKDVNELPGLYKFLHYCIDKQIGHITYNGLAFDSQILAYLLENEYLFTGPNYGQNVDLIINEIHKFAQKCIQLSNTRQFMPYAPWHLQMPQLDLMKMGHWEATSAKAASLKWLQCGLDWPNLQDMPYHHTHYVENRKEMVEIRSYCHNDVSATKKVFEICAEAVDLREKLTKEYGIDLRSASEPRMSKELFLHFLSKRTGTEKKELKKWSTERTDIKIKDILLPYIHFERQEFIMLLNNFRKLVVRGDALRGAFEYNVKYRGMSIDYGMGGLHGTVESGIYQSTETHVIKSYDVASFYPNLCINNKWAPAHIRKDAFCDQYLWFYEERKKHKKGTAKNKAFKLILNSTFGLTIDKFSFLSDPQMGVSICINGQLSLTMLLEMLSENIHDSKPLICNTDSVDIMIKREHEELANQICKQWEAITKLTLECEETEKILALDVNNYISKSGNKIKGKGRFEYEPHDKYEIDVLHKNKSFLVIPKAISAYYFNNTKPEDFIASHRNIYDFCGFARARGQWRFIQITSNSEGIHEKEIQKTLRYFVSKSGSKVVKRKIETVEFINDDDEKEEKDTAKNIQVLAGRYHVTEFNTYINKEWEEYNVNYNWYVKEVYKEITALNSRKVKTKQIPKLDLFSTDGVG